MKISVANTYSDGHVSGPKEYQIPEYTGDLDDADAFADHVRPYTGDGHGLENSKLYAIYEVTVLAAANPALVGRVEEYGG